MQQERQVMETDVLIVGGGPAGLSAAIKLKQLDPDRSVIVLEKASEIGIETYIYIALCYNVKGGHSVSGLVLEPRALDELLPAWRENPGDPCPLLSTPVKSDIMRFLTETRSFPLPHPPGLSNEGNYIGSLSELTRWLGRRATELGVEVYPGFAGAEALVENGRVVGVATNDVGMRRDGKPKANYERGMALKAKFTLLAEGAHGSLSKKIIRRYELRDLGKHQTYGLGLKEVWEVRPEVFRHGAVWHSVGWPLDYKTYGGLFMYHFGENLVSLGMVVGLNYTNPYLNPYREFQKAKLHPKISSLLTGGHCIAYGARALNSGGLQSVPKLIFPGGALIGCSAGFVNVPKIKGTHTAMKSGILAAEAAHAAIESNLGDLSAYQTGYEQSWIYDELYMVRNCKPAFHNPLGLYGGLLWSGVELALRGRTPWTLSHGPPDHAVTHRAAQSKPPEYPKADGVLTFDLLESVSRTGTNHEEDQPVHLVLDSPELQPERSYPLFDGIESRFCPAGVYEYLPTADGNVRLQINAQNCIHCKTCDIKDPLQNIDWTVPEGGGGPKYSVT